MKENSIERDIHLLESYAGMTHKMTDNQGRPKLDQAIEHILSDYKRVLKENEELKAEIQEKEKLINALVDYIAKEDIDEEVCKHIKCVDNEEEKDCRECVKKFFESKIKESEN